LVETYRRTGTAIFLIKGWSYPDSRNEHAGPTGETERDRALLESSRKRLRAGSWSAYRKKEATMSFHPERWTTKRLEKLFERYDQQYWDGAMPRCQIELAHFDPYGMRTLAEAELEKNRILICPENHDNDSGVRDSLLHTMAAIVAGFRGNKNKRKFFSELERLLQRGAPVTMRGFSLPALELPRKLFPLCRREAEKASNRELRRAIRDGAMGDVVCERPGCMEILPVPEGSLSPRRRFCGRTCALENRRRLREGHEGSGPRPVIPPDDDVKSGSGIDSEPTGMIQ
jgi:hypothetical protein